MRNNRNKDICLEETQAIQERTDYLRIIRSSSEKEHRANALASGADEGRDKLRKASGSCK